MNNQHSKCSWMSEHATTLTKTFGGKLFKMYSEQKLGAPLSRVGIRISTWQMQVSTTSFFYKIVQGQYLSTWGQILIVMIKLERQVKITSKEFSYRTESFKYFFLPFCIRKWKILANCRREAKSIKEFKLLLM